MHTPQLDEKNSPHQPALTIAGFDCVYPSISVPSLKANTSLPSGLTVTFSTATAQSFSSNSSRTSAVCADPTVN